MLNVENRWNLTNISVSPEKLVIVLQSLTFIINDLAVYCDAIVPFCNDLSTFYRVYWPLLCGFDLIRRELLGAVWRANSFSLL